MKKRKLKGKRKKKKQSLLKKIKALPRRYWELDLRYHITFAIIAFSLFLTFFRYSGSVLRIIDSIRDLGTSLAHYGVFVGKKLFRRFLGYVPEINATINEIPSIDIQKYIPFSLEELERKFSLFGKYLFDSYVWRDYNKWLFTNMKRWCMSLMLLLPCIAILYGLLLKSLLKTNDLPAGAYSRPYEVFCIALKRLKAPFHEVVNYVKFVLHRSYLKWSLFLLWCVNLNVATIAISAFGYYFYFISSFDIFSVFKQIFKLILDSIIMLSGAPWWFWTLLFFGLYIWWSIKKGYDDLAHKHAMNCGFLKSTDYCINIKGAPGAGKTSLAVHMGLEWNNIQHKDALDIMFSMEMLFPAFPFAAFRLKVEEYIASHLVWCVPQLDIIVDEIEECYNRTPSPHLLYGYDADLWTYDRDTGTALISIFDAMRRYAKAYLIYSNDNLIVSALPIRIDGYFKRIGKHLEKWYGEFFKRTMREVKKVSKYSHILDEDAWRLGKKMDPDGKFAGTFCPGIWIKPEIGKSHGNQFETEGQKRDDDECNEKNDLFHWMLKMLRHVCSTIHNVVFMRVITDEQRPEDLPANLRMIMSIVAIEDKSELKLALPFARQIDWLYEHTYKPFIKFYEDYCHHRSDVVLSVFLMKLAVSGLYNLYWYIYNTFGYYELDLSVEKGSEYGKGDSVKRTHLYYFFVKLAYSERFSTDSHSMWFAKEQIEAGVGIRDYPTYQGIMQTPEEMDAQHDFFIEKMKKANQVADLQDEREREYKKKPYYKANESKQTNRNIKFST